MKNITKIFFLIFIFFTSSIEAKENFFEEAKNLYDKKIYNESKFLFQRNIVYNPKDAKSYLYLAKIYEIEKNDKETEKNLNTTILLEPSNEEAVFMLINMQLKRSNFSEIKKLTEDFKIICSELCDKIKVINERLKNIEAKDES